MKKPFSRKEIDENALVLTVAGSETIASALAAATFLLVKHPEHQKKILDELRTTYAQDSDIDLLSIAKLPYLCALTEECLRLYPAAPNGGQRITPREGNTILGKQLPGNVSLI